jgi:hypothetical protein
MPPLAKGLGLGKEGASGLTWNRNVSFELLSLGIREEEHDAFSAVAAEDAEVLTDAFFSATF